MRRQCSSWDWRAACLCWKPCLGRLPQRLPSSQHTGKRSGAQLVVQEGRPRGCTSAAAPAVCRDDQGRVVLGDIIIGFDGQPIKLQKDLFEKLDDCKVRIDLLTHMLTDSRKLPMHISCAGLRQVLTRPIDTRPVKAQVGQQVELTVMRGNRQLKVKVTLADQKIAEEQRLAAVE